MKKILKLIFALCPIVLWSSCEKHDYAKGKLSPTINIQRVRMLYKGEDRTLTIQNLDGAQIVPGTVISDPSGGNIPEGFITIQSEKGGEMYGITLSVGTAAADYTIGDSIHVNIEGSTLKRINGTLAITGLSAQSIKRIASGRTVVARTVSVLAINSSPDDYESTLVTIYNCNFTPNIGVETLSGDKVFNDGSGEMEFHVNENAVLASKLLPYSSNTTGIVFISPSGTKQIWPRIEDDFINTSIIVDPSIPLGKHPVIITGYLANPTGTDTNYEYVQFMATQDIDFRVTPFSVIINNNATASTPLGFPVNGWVTGEKRSYKFNLTQGTVAKGSFFYVGGNKKIWGANSTDISAANWIASVLYGSVTGADGIGATTTNLLANSGNAAGIAIFKGTDVDVDTEPCDVIFFGNQGNLYSPGPPPVGYKITDNDQYSTNGGTQLLFNQGTNTKKFRHATTENFSKLGGVYNSTLQSWTTVRALTSIALNNSSNIPDLESGSGTSVLEE